MHTINNNYYLYHKYPVDYYCVHDNHYAFVNNIYSH